MAERFIVDADYLSGPDEIDMTVLKLRLAECLKIDGKLQPDGFEHTSIVHMMDSSFQDFQHELLIRSLPVDLYHRVGDLIAIPRDRRRRLNNLRRVFGSKILESPRRRARSFFDDSRLVLHASQAEKQGFDREVDAATERVSAFSQNVLGTLSVGRQVRFIRVGLELSESDDEFAYISSRLLDDSISTMRTSSDLDEVAHECAISPLLREGCRDFVTPPTGQLSSEMDARWNDIVNPPESAIDHSAINDSAIDNSTIGRGSIEDDRNFRT